MNIAYVDYYSFNQHSFKDPITIPLGLSSIGHNVTLIACNPEFDGVADLNGLKVLPLKAIEAVGWDSFGFSAVIFTSRLNANFTNSIRLIKRSGLRLILKTDSDGTLGYPIAPNYLRARPLEFSITFFKNFLRHLKWRIPFFNLIEKKIAQIEIADFIVFESPSAVVNASAVLSYWNRSDLLNKLHFVPNPVSLDAIKIAKADIRRNQIVFVGRWDDIDVKNTITMLKVINGFVKDNKTYACHIIGSGLNEDLIKKYLHDVIGTGRIAITSEIPYIELQHVFQSSKVVVVPSNLESFCFVAAEALCAGCSIAATPIESLIYLSGGGKWGSIAKGFTPQKILNALNREVIVWEQGERNDVETMNFWRAELHPDKIAASFVKLCE